MAAVPPAIPGYRILRPLGQGGMGAAFLAEPDDLPGAVRALKVLPAQDLRARERFLREAELLARVGDHPAVARIHAPGGQPWLVMEWIESMVIEGERACVELLLEAGELEGIEALLVDRALREDDPLRATLEAARARAGRD